MATSKAKGNKAISKANTTALAKFPKSRLSNAINKLAALAGDVDAKQADKGMTALEVCALAHQFAEDNSAAPAETIAKGWTDNSKVVCMELATAGNKFAEVKPGKDDKPATSRWTGYGANVMSIAKGLIEFEIDPATTTEGDEAVSYRSVRKSVEAAREQARREANPDAAALADAKTAAHEAWKVLRDVVFSSNDLGLIKALTESLEGMIEDTQEQEAQQDEIEQDAAQHAA